ncbi:carbohydrate-binding domain-containing protein [Candidatus Saccharibacteria bacterium]|nr:carbohydrate-binding domain-containing protein [Candidatus Saccharibacteria bacterium]
MTTETATVSQTNDEKPAAETNAHSDDRKFDPKWLALGIAGAVVIVGGVAIINNNLGKTPTGTSGITIDNGDTKINWSKYSSYDVDLNSIESYTITKAGIYHFTGTLKDGGITVNTAATDPVKIILDGVTISNSSGPAITCYEADDLVIELVGDNTLSDSASYASTYDEDVTGAIYSKADLTFEGTGTLNLTANYQDGIVGKDDLKINSGIINITATDDGIRGKDSVYIVGGTINISSKGDGIKSTNDTDSDKGFVLIEGGDIVISAGDDGIHALNQLIVKSGTINVAKSYEGLEAKKITISGGDVSVTASDDGINAGGGSDSTTATGQGATSYDTGCMLIIEGGNLYVNAAGDGVDSNGYIYFNGGTVTVDGPTNNGNGALDAGISIQQNGGTVVAVGASGMAENLGSTSTVNNVSIYFSATQTAGTKIEIKDSAGNLVTSFTSAKLFNHMAVGSPDFKTGETYTIYINGTEYQSFTISTITTTVGSGGMTPGGQPGAQHNTGTTNATQTTNTTGRTR